MGYKKLSNEQELQLVDEYKQGTSVNSLMQKYGFKTKKSITDKVKKHFPNQYQEIIKEAQKNRKQYCYKLEKINCEFDAYFLGLMLTDGYVTSDRNQIGIDLADEDCISFLSKSIGKDYKKYNPNISTYNGQIINSQKNRYRLILDDKELASNLRRFGVVPKKSKILKGPQLFEEEEKFIPYIIRGIIDGDGTVCPTSYGGPQFRIITASYDFSLWLKDVLENKMYMIDINIHKKRELYELGSADSTNILKLISLSYNKPFGMTRKYNEIRKTFRDYNGDFLN